MSKQNQPTNRWHLLVLSSASHTFAAAIPYSCMPVLFKEISDDLGLSLVQIGAVWGMVGLAGVFVALASGLIGDRFGVRRTLGIACLLVGVTGALRGLSFDFVTLAVTVFAFGLLRRVVPVNVHKTVSTWFRGRNMGVANGAVALGMGIGLMLGPAISATVLSPWLGGWRNVLFFYGAASAVVGMIWLLFVKEPPHGDLTPGHSSEVSMRQALARLVRIKHLWFAGLTVMFRMGTIMGVTGYLPLYLRNRGWAPGSADATLAVFYAASSIAVIPLAFFSDRIGSRKAVLFPALLAAITGTSLLPFVDGLAVWIMVILVGAFVDAFMAITLTLVQETEGVGPAYSGTALGLVFTISQVGPFISPPLGNSLASISPWLPFVFWASLSAVALVTLALTKETGRRRKGSTGDSGAQPCD